MASSSITPPSSSAAASLPATPTSVPAARRKPIGSLQWRLTLLFSLALVISFLLLQGVLYVGLFTAALAQAATEAMRDPITQHGQQIRAAVIARDATALQTWIAQQHSASPSAWSFATVPYTEIHAQVDFAASETVLMITDAEGQVLAWDRNESIPAGPIQRTSAIPIALRNELLSAIVTPETPTRVKTDAEGRSIVIARIEDDAKTLRGLLVLHARAIDRWVAIRSGVRYYLAGNGGGYTCINAQLAFPLGLLLSYWVARRVTRRLDKLAAASAQWSQSQFDARINDEGNNDELSVVAQQLNDMAAQMNQLLLERQERAALEERTRIMQDLHDSAKQQALAVSSRLATVRVLMEREPAQARALLQETEKLHDLLKRELTALITGSPPPLLEDKGIAEAMREHVRIWSAQTGITAQVQAESDLDLPLDLSHALFRITQEALANVEKHSGANHVDIIFRCCSDPILQVRDNGRGFAVQHPTSGFGLFSMRERVRKMGGTLDLISEPGHGTTVTVRKWSLEGGEQGE